MRNNRNEKPEGREPWKRFGVPSLPGVLAAMLVLPLTLHPEPSHVIPTIERLMLLDYPKEALETQTDGSVQATLMLNREGEVKTVSFAHDNPGDAVFEEYVRDTTKYWRFNSRGVGQQRLSFTFRFRIDESGGPFRRTPLALATFHAPDVVEILGRKKW